MAAAKEQLRLFQTLDSKRAAAQSAAAAATAATKQREAALAAGSSPRFLFHAVSSLYDQATTALLLHIVAHGYTTSGSAALPGFDRSSSSSSSSGSADPLAAEGQLAAAFADRLVPGWWHLTRGLLWRWHLRRLMEMPCWGVPGLSSYYRARAAWLREQIQLAIDGDGCRQVVLLRPGLATWSHSLAQPAVKFYEVDSRPAVQRKKQLLDELLPGWRHAAQRPRFVEVDFSCDSALKLLLTELTGAGFDPSERCCVVAEGLLPFLSQEQASGLLADLSALAAPGSRLLFDFVHADALDALLAASNPTGSSSSSSSTTDSEVPPGLPNLAAALANKGAPLRSGLPPSFSGMVKFLQPHNFRLSALLPPHELARYATQQQQQQQQRPGAAAAKASSPAGSSGAAGGKAGSQAAATARLPFVPEFYSFASAVKQDPRLLLRHADLALATTGASDAADGSYNLAAGWEAVRGAALGSPTCLLRSLGYLFCGSTTLAASCWGPAAGAAPVATTGTAAGTAAAASPAALYPAPPAPTAPASPAPAGLLAATDAAASAAAASPVAAPARRQMSTEWSLAVGHFLASRSSSSEPATAGGSSPQQRAAAGAAALAHAESIAALLPLPHSSKSSSCGDEGHLWAAAAASPSSIGTGQQPADGGHVLGGTVPAITAGAAAAAAAPVSAAPTAAAPAAAAPAAGAAAAPAGTAGASMASAAASVAALAAEIAAAIEQDFDSQSTGEGYWWMWTS